MIEQSARGLGKCVRYNGASLYTKPRYNELVGKRPKSSVPYILL